MFEVQETSDGQKHVFVIDPPLARYLFASTASSPIWLVVRAFVGWEWLWSGTHGLADPNWQQSVGEGLVTTWRAALDASAASSATPLAAPLRGGLQLLLDTHAENWMPSVMAAGEVVVGIAVMLGLLVGLSCAAGLLVDLLIFLLAGVVAIGSMLAPFALLLMLAWKNAGFIGFDRYLLRSFGAPWWEQAASSREFRPRP